jgi:DNA invertase Pin-like site-specific DNA recombinase
MERLAINERIASARDRHQAEGRAWGRPKAIPATALAQAERLRAQGRSLRQIATELGLPRSTLARSLSRNVPKARAA